MTSLQAAESFRQRFRTSFVGPVAIAILFGGGLNALVRAVNEPSKALLDVLINRLISQAHLHVVPLPTQVSWGVTVDAAIAACGLVLLATVLGLWMIPLSNSGAGARPR